MFEQVLLEINTSSLVSPLVLRTHLCTMAPLPSHALFIILRDEVVTIELEFQKLLLDSLKE